MSCPGGYSDRECGIIVNNIAAAIEKELLIEQTVPLQFKGKLSCMDIKILSLLAKGYERKTICDEMQISMSTLKRHSYKLYLFWGEENIIRLVLRAVSSGLIDTDGNIRTADVK